MERRVSSRFSGVTASVGVSLPGLPQPPSTAMMDANNAPAFFIGIPATPDAACRVKPPLAGRARNRRREALCSTREADRKPDEFAHGHCPAHRSTTTLLSTSLL